MPDTLLPLRKFDSYSASSASGESGASIRAETGSRPLPAPPNPNPPVSGWLLGMCGLAVLVLVGLGWYWFRQSALRTWKKFAEQIHGEFKAKNRISPALVVGTIQERPFLMETTIGHDDDAPYYHTRAAVPIRNPDGLILGLRRKSMLEEAQTRGEKATVDLEDPDFERRFILVCNHAEGARQILTPAARRELLRYNDVEIYIRMDEMEWRRGGEQNELPIIQRLTDLLLTMAKEVDALPRRVCTLSERLTDEALIQKGV